MKLVDLFESEQEFTDEKVIMSSIDEIMIRGAYIDYIDGDNESLNVQIVYEFPEHRSGLIQGARKAFGKSGKVNVEKVTVGPGSYGASYTFEFTKPLKNVKKIIKTIKDKYK
jgi:hypothetical protein